jgi:type V secretory pathway adhesin AidA
MSLTDPNANLFDGRLNAFGAAIAGNMGYRVPIFSQWFIEPSVGASLAKAWVLDKIDVPGAAVFVDQPTVRNDGTVTVDEVTSILGRGSLRIGANVPAGNWIWQPFATASIFHEFAGEATANADGLRTSTERIGTFYQFGLGSSVVMGDSGWLAYSRVDYRTGDNTEGLGVHTGIRYHW